MNTGNTDLDKVVVVSLAGTEKAALDAKAPIAIVPDGIVLEEAEQAALSRMMEYTRKGSMKKRMVTRQQWIEDLLTRGFNVLEEKRFGRAPMRLRITAPDRLDRRGKPQFYEVQSAIEIAYVKARHATLFPSAKKTGVSAEAVPSATTTPPKPPAAAPTSAGVAVSPPKQEAAPFATLWANRVQTELIDAPVSDRGPQTLMDLKAFGRNEPEVAERLIRRLSVAGADMAALERRVVMFIRRYVALRQTGSTNSIGMMLALFERGDAWADAAWFLEQAFRHGDLEATIKPLPRGRELRDAVRGMIGEDKWMVFLRDRLTAGSRGAKKAADVDTTAVAPDARDFFYTPGEEVTPAGKKTRIRANIEVIKLLKKLETEDRNATPEEKKTLARYNGWGEHKAFFEQWDERIAGFKDYYGTDYITKMREAVANEKQRYGGNLYANTQMGKYLDWYDEYGRLQEELRAIMTETEWNSASRSILNAHYTSEEICHWLWKIVDRVGFKGGRILEPAVGASGRILGAMPPEMRANSRVEAIELDTLSARIAKKLYPQTKIHECGFEEALIAPGSVDLVITNVPFNETGPGVQEGIGPVQFNLHNYFIAEAMRKLKPSGLALIITSASTMQFNEEQREELARQVELWGAVRLPSSAFEKNAGTQVVTDVMLLRKPDGTMQACTEEWKRLLPIEHNGIKMSEDIPQWEAEQFLDAMAKRPASNLILVNEYFVRNPEMVIGRHSMEGRMYGRKVGGQYTVTLEKKDGELSEHLDRTLAKMPANVPHSAGSTSDNTWTYFDAADHLMATMEERPGSAVLREDADGNKTIYIVRPSRELIEPEWMLSGDLPTGVRTKEAGHALLSDYCKLRDKLLSQIALDLNPATLGTESAAHRRGLKEVYDSFVKKNGTLNDMTKRLRGLAPTDSTMGSVFALEQVRDDEDNKRKKRVFPTAILTERTLFPPQKMRLHTTGSLEDAVSACLGQTGTVDIPYICDLLGTDDTGKITEDIIKLGVAFRSEDNPEALIHRSKYLTGDVLTKLKKAKATSVADPRLTVNVAALEAVIPAHIPFERITASFGGTWIPGHIYQSFINETYNTNMSDMPYYDQRSQKWLWAGLGGYGSETARSRLALPENKRSWAEIIMDALSQVPPKIFDAINVGGEKKQVFNATATAQAKMRIDELCDSFHRWVVSRADTRKELTDLFNEKFNRVVVPNFDGSYLTFPGKSDKLEPRFYQRNAVARCIMRPAGVLAHGTGYGKTLSGILIAGEHRRIKLSQKPLIVCDSANYAQFVEAYRETYPQARILVADDANFSPKERENFKAMVAYGDWDCVLMSRTQFEKIPLSNQTLTQWIAGEISDLRWSLNLAKNIKDKRQQRNIENRLLKKEAALKAYMDDKEARSDPGLTWEQIGVDLLIVDECHRHKKTGFATAFDHIKGIDSTESNRGRDLLMKARIIQDRRNGMGVIGLSGTPATNTMAEFWNMNRIFDPNILRDYNVEFFDEFKTLFCETETKLEMNEANGRFRYVERMSKFVNGHVLAGFVRSGADVQLDSSKLNLTLPAYESGDIELTVLPATDAVLRELDELGAIYEKYEKMSGKMKHEYSWVPITLTMMGMAASIDPRLINAKATDEPDSLVNRVVNSVSDIYQRTSSDRKAQVIFLDRYRTMNTSILDGLKSRGIEAAEIVLDDSKEGEVGAGDLDDSESTGRTSGKDKKTVTVHSGINLYDDIREKLMARGIPANEIAIINEANGPKERADIFEKVSNGAIRVVMGSSDNLGIGSNFQKNLYAAHNVDAPRNMTPDQQEQRDGRIVRSGNSNEKVRVILYGMQDTCTPAIWNRVQTKRRFIRSGLSETGGADEVEDMGEIRYEEFKAALIADKRQLQLSELNAEIRDENMAISMVRQRRISLESRATDLENMVRHWRERRLPDEREKAAWIAANTKSMLDGPIVIDLKKIRDLPDKPDKLRAWFAKRDEESEKSATDVIMTDSIESASKALTPLVDALKETNLDNGQRRKNLGALTVNGFEVSISYARFEYKSGRDGIGLLLDVGRQVPSGTDGWTAFKSFLENDTTLFGTANMLLRTTANMPSCITERVNSGEACIRQYEADLVVVRSELIALPKTSTDRLQKLMDEKAALEKDMVDNPYVRGSKRGSVKIDSLRREKPSARPVAHA
jgi:N12 class adenine-specific DNA methylase